MSIQTEIDRINTGVAAAYEVLEGLGATMPTAQTVNNLAATAATALNSVYSKVLLWKNASPTSDFAPQDIAVNVGEYDGIEIMFNAFNGFNTSRQGYWLSGSSNINLIATESDWSLGYSYFVSRRAGVTATNVNFGNCYASNNTAKNGRMIPIAIYGIRGVG